MRKLFGLALLATVLAIPLLAQAPATESLTILTKDLPPASLWDVYHFSFQARGGVEPYSWRVVAGTLPKGFRLESFGELTGTEENTDGADFTLQVTDKANKQLEKRFVLRVAPPLKVEWGRKAEVNGQAINGSVKVSNQTGRTFDLTFVVLAVNDIGRATAIGYQHFPLKKNTRDLPLPFGDTLSPGTYEVNVDVVGEEPLSKRIFRARLVTGKETISQGP